MGKKKAVCLLSGGLDSAVAAAICKQQGYDIYALSFNYGQRHNKELLCAKKIGKHLNVKKHVFFNLDLQQFGGSSLFNQKKQKIPTHEQKKIGSQIPSTYVPARNTVFLAIALGFAETCDADAIFIGANAIDYSGYPDCRPEYIAAVQNMVNLATKKTIEGKKIIIHAPLLMMTKAEIIKKGLQLGVPFEHTWSCYKGGTKACGRCDSCVLRLQGFHQAKINDPLPYQKKNSPRIQR
ncbi:MAG: 7-cyano-7-deazaguanine synthase QueC [Candidatus Thermoplasmatota archaeon]